VYYQEWNNKSTRDSIMSEHASSYVTRTEQGAWRITGTRISLDSVVHAYWDGRLPEVIAADIPSLTLEQIHGAIAFYLRNQSEIDKYLSEQDARWQQLQQESAAKHGPLLQRIRQATNRSSTGSGS
jgi:uncharacterized protein (DUF433 family)